MCEKICHITKTFFFCEYFWQHEYFWQQSSVYKIAIPPWYHKLSIEKLLFDLGWPFFILHKLSIRSSFTPSPKPHANFSPSRPLIITCNNPTLGWHACIKVGTPASWLTHFIFFHGIAFFNDYKNENVN